MLSVALCLPRTVLAACCNFSSCTRALASQWMRVAADEGGQEEAKGVAGGFQEQAGADSGAGDARFQGRRRTKVNNPRARLAEARGGAAQCHNRVRGTLAKQNAGSSQAPDGLVVLLVGEHALGLAEYLCYHRNHHHCGQCLGPMHKAFRNIDFATRRLCPAKALLLREVAEPHRAGPVQAVPVLLS